MSAKISVNSLLSEAISIFKAFIFSRAVASLSLAVASKKYKVRNQ